MRTAFAIMPFDASLAHVYSDLIKPGCADAGVEVRRADEITRQRNVMRDLVEGLLFADLIIADLTYNRASVFYELGVAHTLLRPVIVLTRDIATVAFDLRLHRVIQYDADDPGASRHALVQALAAAEGVEFERSNPIAEFVPPPVLYKLLQANRRIRTSGELNLYRNGDQAYLRVEGDVWKGLVNEPSYEIASIAWGGSGGSWGYDGTDAVSTPFSEAGMTLGPLPLTPRGDVRGTPYVRTIHGEVIYFDLYAWTITPEAALMQAEVVRKGSLHRSAILDFPLAALPEVPTPP